MWYWDPGYGWGAMLVDVLVILGFWGCIAAAVMLAVHSLGAARRTATYTALKTLRRRLAAGAITVDEYERLRKILRH